MREWLKEHRKKWVETSSDNKHRALQHLHRRLKILQFSNKWALYIFFETIRRRRYHIK